ncbi:MAG: tetratricopeptide repeat-containing diguanylate cyclase [Pseudoxanthomonas sp.]|nr:tetratricopeptide repeat-containing diguanylate cyclase [Pseudoxanthomonas sp.]
MRAVAVRAQDATAHRCAARACPVRALRALSGLLAGLLVAVATAVAQSPPAAEDCEALSNTDPAAAHALAERQLAAPGLSLEAEIQARMCLAWSHVRTGEADQARAEADRLLDLAAREGLSPAVVTAALRRAGSVHFSLGDRHDAVDRFVQALEIADEHGLDNERIGLLINLGIARGSLDEGLQAQAHFEEALRLMEATGHRQHEPPLLNNYGLSLVQNGEPGRGLPLLERALELAEAQGNRVGIAHVTHSIGFALRQLGRLEEAEASLRRALAERREIGARAGEGATLLELARVEQARGELAAALADAETAVALARETGDEATERDGMHTLSTLYASLGRIPEAYQAERRNNEMNLRFAREQNVQRLAELEARLRSQMDRRELELLRRDNEIQALQLERDRLARRYGIGLLALIVLAAGLATWHQRRVNRQLRHANAKDDMTGLSNRRHMTRVLDWLQAHRGTAALQAGPVRAGVLFLIDIDRFKSINDRFGHEVGDKVLVTVAQRLRASTRGGDRGGDRLCRWGGEEFLVAAPDLTEQQAMDMAERLRSLVSAAPVTVEGGASVPVSVSVGFAPWPLFEGGAALPWLLTLRLADQALYLAKDAGRDTWAGYWGGVWPAGRDAEGLARDLARHLPELLRDGTLRLRRPS